MTGKIYLVLDNHSVHTAQLVAKEYEDTFKLLFLPAYSSYLSGVETLWAILKIQLGKHLDRIRYDMNMLKFEAEVDWMCSVMMMKYDGRKIFMSARNDLQKVLDEDIPEEVQEESEETDGQS